MAKFYKQITTNGVYVKHYPLVVICFFVAIGGLSMNYGTGS